MKHFVLVFDRRTGHVLDSVEFSEFERAKALEERFQRELAYRADPNVEVVSLAAESREDLTRTHTRYFFDELRRRAASLG